MVQLGDRVRDKVTGFEGVVVSRTEWLHGADFVQVQPPTVDAAGAPAAMQQFDVRRVEPAPTRPQIGVIYTSDGVETPTGAS